MPNTYVVGHIVSPMGTLKPVYSSITKCAFEELKYM
jgi:hypothetical protein